MRKFAKSILVTGAGSGIGRAIAQRFMREGYGAILVGRRSASLLETAQGFDRDMFVAITSDVSRDESVEALFSQLSHGKENEREFLQKLNVVVNNAGIFAKKSFLETDLKTWHELFNTNLFGAIRVARAATPWLANHRGVIVNISSGLALRPGKDTSAYAASKAALNNLTEAMALELAPLGVRVNGICPGIVDTPIHAFHHESADEKTKYGSWQPLGRIGHADEIACGVWALSGPGSEWTTGALLTIDGGIRLQ